MLIANMDAGKAMRVLMSEKNVSAGQVAKDLGVSSVTVTKLRREKLISGRNLVMVSEYFGMTAANFLRKGEKKED